MDGISEATQPVTREPGSRNCSWYTQLAACPSADSHIQMSWFTASGADFTARPREMAHRGDIAVYRLGPPAVHVNGGHVESARVDSGLALAELPLIVEWRLDAGDAAADLDASPSRTAASSPGCTRPPTDPAA
ncbi:hypothetical protein [Streptomyces sp. NPDC055060]